MKNNNKAIKIFNAIWESHFKEGSFFSAAKQVEFFLSERFFWIKNNIPLKPGMKVLNCGCGSGQWSIPFALEGVIIYNLDMSQAALDITKQRFRDKNLYSKYVLGDINNLPFKANYFDAVVSFGVLEHFENIHLPISEMHRVLKPGGFLFADVITSRFSLRFLEQLILSIQILLFKILTLQFSNVMNFIKPFRPDFFENSFSINEYILVLRENNLKNIKSFGVRAYPLISLPPILDNFYARALKIFRNFWRAFDSTDTYIVKRYANIFCLLAKK